MNLLPEELKTYVIEVCGEGKQSIPLHLGKIVINIKLFFTLINTSGFEISGASRLYSLMAVPIAVASEKVKLHWTFKQLVMSLMVLSGAILVSSGGTFCPDCSAFAAFSVDAENIRKIKISRNAKDTEAPHSCHNQL